MYIEKVKASSELLKELIHCEFKEAEWGSKASQVRERIEEAVGRPKGSKAIIVKESGRRSKAIVAQKNFRTNGNLRYVFRLDNPNSSRFREVHVQDNDKVEWVD